MVCTHRWPFHDLSCLSIVMDLYRDDDDDDDDDGTDSILNGVNGSGNTV